MEFWVHVASSAFRCHYTISYGILHWLPHLAGFTGPPGIDTDIVDHYVNQQKAPANEETSTMHATWSRHRPKQALVQLETAQGTSGQLCFLAKSPSACLSVIVLAGSLSDRLTQNGGICRRHSKVMRTQCIQEISRYSGATPSATVQPPSSQSCPEHGHRHHKGHDGPPKRKLRESLNCLLLST